MSGTTERADLLAAVCALLERGEGREASAFLDREYPFSRTVPVSRTCTPAQALKVFRGDGFLDRYSGGRLIFPGVLRVLSSQLPTQFPYHPNWKVSETHFAYWELYPTVDHRVPITRGGADRDDNWVTTSMMRNAAKGNWTLEELGWNLPDLKRDPGVRTWYRAISALA